MTNLTSSNYFSTDANKSFWSVSSFKAFDKCEASGLAQVRGQYERPETDALLSLGRMAERRFFPMIKPVVSRMWRSPFPQPYLPTSGSWRASRKANAKPLCFARMEYQTTLERRHIHTSRRSSRKNRRVFFCRHSSHMMPMDKPPAITIP